MLTDSPSEGDPLPLAEATPLRLGPYFCCAKLAHSSEACVPPCPQNTQLLEATTDNLVVPHPNHKYSHPPLLTANPHTPPC